MITPYKLLGQPVKSPWETSRSETPTLAAITRTATCVASVAPTSVKCTMSLCECIHQKFLKSRSRKKKGGNAESSAKMDRKTRNSSGLFGAPRVSCADPWWPKVIQQRVCLKLTPKTIGFPWIPCHVYWSSMLDDYTTKICFFSIIMQ